MNKQTKHTSSGIGFCTALTLIFVVLKLTNLIQWSWTWVLSPLWILYSIYILLLVVFILVLSVDKTIEAIKITKRNKEKEKENK